MKHNPSNPFSNLRPLSYPCFSPETISLTSKYLSETIFNQLNERSTSSGFTLAHAVNSGMINPDSAMGIYAGDAECYKTFAPIFDLVIEAYHSLSLSQSRSDHQTDSFPKPMFLFLIQIRKKSISSPPEFELPAILPTYRLRQSSIQRIEKRWKK